MDWGRGDRLKRAVIIALLMVAAAAELPRWSANPVWMRDFIDFWLPGPAVAAGVDPYDLPALIAFAQGLFPAIWPPQVNFTYPPHAILLFAPLGLLSPTAAYVLWSLFSVGLFAWAAWPLMPKGLPLAVAVMTPACYINLRYGQSGLLSAALFLLAFRPNGIAAALLTFKPQLGALVIPAVARSPKAFVTAVVLTVAMVAASALIWPDAWPGWFQHATKFQGAKLASGAEQAWMSKAVTPMIWYGLAGWLVYAAGAAWFLSRNYNVFTAATATFLISPYGFHYDMAAVCLGFLILLYSHWDELPHWQKAAASLAFLTPVIVDYGTWLIPPILLVGLFVQTQWFEPTTLHIRRARGHKEAHERN